jgi:hypothetical protein
MDRQTLNQKVWYRAVKVIFVILFLFCQIIGFGIASEFSIGKISYIKCDNGKIFDSYYPFSDKEKIETYKRCDPTAYYSNSSSQTNVLSESSRQELDKIVIQMTKENALEYDIQKVVNNFKLTHTQPQQDLDMNKTYTMDEFVKITGHDANDSVTVNGGNWFLDYKIEYRDKYSLIAKSSFYILSFLTICLLFWVIRRIFFYIFIKERFLKL